MCSYIHSQSQRCGEIAAMSITQYMYSGFLSAQAGKVRSGSYFSFQQREDDEGIKASSI